jgi:predicted metal-dependent hydrolase
MDHMHCEHNGERITYILKRRRYQRQINLIAHQDGSLTVTAPRMCSVREIHHAIKTHQAWIRRHVGNNKKNVTIEPRVVHLIKKALRPIVEAKILQFNEYYQLSYGRISIRNQKTRWGSCSAEGNLNFNCKLMCLSDALRDYVIVHELCHLKEMNHSPAFWQLVAQTIPNYKELRKELKRVTI